MAKKLVIVFLLSMVLSSLFTFITIKLTKKLRARQTILQYVTKHKAKQGTPTMGGLGFLMSSIVCYLAFYFRNGKIALVSLLIFFVYSLLGFLDDFIKVRFSKNQGLTPWQKIIFQSLIAIIVVGYAVYNGLTNLYIPILNRFIDIGYFMIPLGIFAIIATTNCVNLTDGLDGLSGTTTCLVLLFFAVITFIQTSLHSQNYIVKEEFNSLIGLSVTIAGSLIGFLLFNTYRASIFMGDTGALGLGGVVAALYLFSGNLLYIPLVGICYLISGVSVILQVMFFKLKGKRIFLIAPYHHHLELKEKSESKIVFIYFFITLIMGLLSVIFLL